MFLRASPSLLFLLVILFHFFSESHSHSYHSKCDARPKPIPHRPHPCPKSLCNNSTCPELPKADCIVTSLCGECRVRWILCQHRNKWRRRCKDVTQYCKCGKNDQLNCEINACEEAKCPSLPKAQCRTDCETCTTTWFLWLRDVTKHCSDSGAMGTTEHKKWSRKDNKGKKENKHKKNRRKENDR